MISFRGNYDYPLQWGSLGHEIFRAYLLNINSHKKFIAESTWFWNSVEEVSSKIREVGLAKGVISTLKVQQNPIIP